ncbi:cellobiose transport system permease protein [Paenibacillus sp. 1_12]|uniref:carbohydrate ABC transporter permease n=1 Tax=Paenibacillus sp. 1_12 TaxID=1566278 RepID=UPI0008EA5350|nr:sugar ABC transporter permease [Paenibacillus sp. 1_12]SFK97219.1 cellobiose transport system permease protein [Paenibacillus sp. 1_12]
MQRVGKKATPYLMVTPYFLLYIAFGLFPILFSFVISFTKWDGITDMVFVGLANYIRIFTNDSLFYESLYNTILIIVITIPVEIVLGLLLAVFLKDFFRKSRNALQLINFLPYITTPVAIGIIFQILFDWKNGSVNAVLGMMGIDSVYWLGFPWAARLVVILMMSWTAYGYKMVLFLSGLSTIPEELYESAKIDGARWWDSFIHITIPMLKPIMLFVVITSIINGFRLFDEPQLLFQSASQPIGGPDHAVLTVVMRYYDVAFHNFEFGYGSAIAYSLFIVISIFSIFSMKIMNRKEES